MMRNKANLRYRRRMRLLLLLCLLTVSFSSGFLVHASAIGTSTEQTETYAERPYERIYVVSGDTLWTIAERHAPADEDIRDYIGKIRKANGLKTSSLTAGQKLILP